MSSVQLYFAVGSLVLGLIVIILGRGGSEGVEVEGRSYTVGAGLVLTLIGIGLLALYFSGISIF